MIALINALLGFFSMIGSVCFGLWIVNRKKTSLGLTALGLIFAAAMLLSSLTLLSAPTMASDPRPLSLFFGSWGAVFCLRWLMKQRSVKNHGWARAGITLGFMLFFLGAWWGPIQEIRSGGASSLVPGVTVPTVTTPSTPSLPDDVCKNASARVKAARCQ